MESTTDHSIDGLEYEEPASSLVRMNELASYTLAGGPKSPRQLFGDVTEAEALGLGSTFISERWNIKEALTLAGAAAAISHDIGIATGVTNHNTRHPLATMSHATTMHRLTNGRYALGLGRGLGVMQDMFGIPRITTVQLEEFATVARRLWHGETILGYDGPLGRFPVLSLDPAFDDDIPLLLTAFGEHSLRLGGRAFDGVILHTFFSDETTSRCVRAVRQGAERAGRDPACVRVWSCYATVSDLLDEDLRLKKTVGRMASYLQGYGDLMVQTNGWDPAVLDRFRHDPLVGGFKGSIDEKATTSELEHIATLIPSEWLEAAATGSPQRCAERVLAQFDLGVDGVIMHGATPAELAPVVDAYRGIRPPGRFDRYAPNPGRLTTSYAASSSSTDRSTER